MLFSKIFNSNRNFIEYIKALVGFKSKDVALTLTLMVFISLTEGIGLLLLVPLLQLVGLDVQQGALGQIADFIAYIFSYIGITPTLASVLVIYVVIISLNAFLYRLQNIKGSEIEYEFAAYIRKNLFTAITGSTWLFFTSKRSPDFAHALTYEIERITSGTSYFISLITGSIILAVYVIFALNISGVITGFIFMIGVILLIILQNRAESAGRSGEELSEITKDIYSSTLKQMDGMKTIKSFGMESKNIELFNQEADGVSRSYMGAVYSYADVRMLFDVGSVVVLSFIVFILIEIMAIPTAELLILLFIFVRMIPQFSTIQLSYQYFINMLPAFKTVVDLENECQNAAEPKLNVKKITFDEKIKLRGISFSYMEKNKAFSLNNINLSIKAGKTTAIAGLSGAGKSTIADMIMGLIIPNKGTIFIDSIPLMDDNIINWRKQIGYVAQDTFLFNDTVRNNLRFADPNADDEEIINVLNQVSADEFVLKLPEGLDTLIGDRGVLLSGGEKQRLALARALLKKPSLLILDEATSNLDSKNEKNILSSLEKLHGNLTILMIAHRLSTIRNADVIYLIEKGNLVESGTWKELINKDEGYFKSLYEAQMSD